MEYLDYLLNSIPDDVDYTEFPSELDEDDITQDRIEGLNRLLYFSINPILSFRAACLLCSWGKEVGAKYIIETTLSESDFLELFKLANPNDICLNVVRSLVDYLSVYNELTMLENNEIRNDIILCLRKMILIGNVMDFDIKDIFFLIEYGMEELLPDLELYFINKANNIFDNLWVIYDFILFFKKYNNCFLVKWVEVYKDKYADFIKMIKEIDMECYNKIYEQ